MLDRNKVKSVLPQKGAAKMVDALLHAAPLMAESEFKITEGNSYLDETNNNYGLVIENMAQTFLLGAYSESDEASAQSLYLLAAVNYIKTYDKLKVDDQIKTRTSLIKSAMGIYKVHGKTYLGNALIAESEFVLKEIKNV
jgi:3-hydroxymyristoyl/3-hydroxydecanoyl-(acyl carrier protein) dehydratase